MKLESVSGSSVSLDVARYQFPARPGGDGDWGANWLVIRGEASDAGRAWHFSDPCLTTWEARELGSWLQGVAAGQVRPQPLDEDGDGGLTFTEPNLELSLHAREADTATIRFHFSLESAPPWIDGEERYELYKYFVELTVPLSAVQTAANEWRDELAHFPVRR